MSDPLDREWSAWLDGLQAWARRTTVAVSEQGLALPDEPRGGPTGPVPEALRLRAGLVLAELAAVEQLLARRRARLTREHAYS